MGFLANGWMPGMSRMHTLHLILKKEEEKLEKLQYGKREQKWSTQKRTETNVGVGKNSETSPLFLKEKEL